MKIIGHRGLPESYPENTILSLEKALASGADGVEFDVQFSNDAVPFVFHDIDFVRTASLKLQIKNLSAADISRLSVHEPARFGEHFYPQIPARLDELIQLSQRYPRASYFVEVKDDAFAHLSRSEVYGICRELILGLSGKWVFISYDFEFVQLVKNAQEFACGWVLESFDAYVVSRAQMLQPDFLISDKHHLVGQNVLVSGAWDWFIYDISDRSEMLEWEKRGASWVESWDVRTLIDPL